MVLNYSTYNDVTKVKIGVILEVIRNIILKLPNVSMISSAIPIFLRFFA